MTWGDWATACALFAALIGLLCIIAAAFWAWGVIPGLLVVIVILLLGNVPVFK